MKEMPTDDPLFGKGTIRADGRKIHDMYLFEVKTPDESKEPWDYYKLARHDPGRGGLPAAGRRRLPAGRSRSASAGAGLQDRTDPHAADADLRHPPAGALRAAPARPDQRLLLRDAEPGLAVIFGLLNIVNFAHGAQYMMGAFVRLDAAATSSASATGGRCCSRR